MSKKNSPAEQNYHRGRLNRSPSYQEISPVPRGDEPISIEIDTQQGRCKSVSIKTLIGFPLRGLTLFFEFYGLALGKAPWAFVIAGLALGFGCASGLRYIRVVDIDYAKDFTNERSWGMNASAFLHWANSGCSCRRAYVDSRRKRSFSNYMPKTVGKREAISPTLRKYACDGPSRDSPGTSCHGARIFLLFVDTNSSSVQGFLELSKFDKLLRVEQEILNDAMNLRPDFNFWQLCRRKNAESSFEGFLLQSLNATEVRAAIRARILPFPFFENKQIVTQLLGYVKTKTSRDGSMTLASARATRTQVEFGFLKFENDNGKSKRLYEIWQRRFHQRMTALNAKWQKHYGIQVYWSQHIELTPTYALDAMLRLLPKFAATICAVALWASIAMTGSDSASSKPWLGIIGICSTLLASCAGIGFLAYLGEPFPYPLAAIPFLVLAIGLDDMFVLLTALRHTKPTDALSVRMKKAMAEGGTAIAMTAMTNLISEAIGTKANTKILSIIMSYTLVLMTFDFLLQITIFAGSAALLSIGDKAKRNPCCCCARLELRTNPVIRNRKIIYQICCTAVPGSDSSEDSALFRLVHTFAKFLIGTPARFAVIGVYIIYCSAAVFGLMNLYIGVRDEHTVPYNSPEYAYLKAELRAFQDSTHVSFYVQKQLDYSNPSVQLDLIKAIKKIEESSYYYTGSGIRFWLQSYLSYLKRNETRKSLALSNRETFWTTFYDNFIKEEQAEYLLDDMKICGDDRRVVCQSRGHLISKDMATSSRQVGQLIFAETFTRQYAESALGISIYDTHLFPRYEIIRTSEYINAYYILITVGIAVAISIFFIQDVTIVFWVLAMLLSEILGLVGFMPFIGMDFDLISLSMLIINIGYSVDFVIHLSYDYLIAPSDTRTGKTIHALTDVGHAVIPAGSATIMSVLAMATTGMYAYEVFFKSLSLAVGISVAHACFFLPVALSLLGPVPSTKVEPGQNSTSTTVTPAVYSTHISNYELPTLMPRKFISENVIFKSRKKSSNNVSATAQI